MSEVTFIHLSHTCHVCKTATFRDKTRLREHLSEKEDITIEAPKSGKRRINKNIVFIKSSELNEYARQGAVIVSQHACPGCNDSFDELDDLRIHIDRQYLAFIDESYSVMASAPIPPTIMPHIASILDTDDMDKMPMIKKPKTTAEAITRLYGFHTDSGESSLKSQPKMIGGILESIGLKAYTMFPNTEDECYSVSTETQLPQIMMACEKKGISVVPCVSSEVKCDEDDSKNKVEINDGYIQYLISTGKINTAPLLADRYREVTESQLELLNEDWNSGFHLRAVCTQLLAGCLLIEKDEVLLVNCIELYSRSKHQDIHFERFNRAPSSSSVPTGNGTYETINICNIDLDNSHRLIIGSNIFSGLVTSSLRLDSENLEPELGPSTYHFHPTTSTKLFIAYSSSKKANVILVKKSTQINNYDKFSQLRQLRSNFTIPTTYCLSRCLSRFTDNLHMRPYTIFTAFCAEGDELSDVKFGSSIMRFIAAVVFRQEKTFSCKQLASIAPPIEKTTYVFIQYKKILELGSVNDTITIFGNLALEGILCAIAEKITPPLKELNSKTAKKIANRIKSLN
ncbi:hypothetical protein BDF14DRAFT_1852526 [Spinellus fusiger]|nr:hypothetical protein BDF14DRAFT_1852526 [Spinellus fusiger]